MSRKDDPSRDASDVEKAELGRRIDAHRAAREAKNRPARPQGWAIGWRYGSEFIAGVVVGAVLGLVLDVLTGWTPWGLIGGIMLGFTVGAWNVVRAANELNAPDPGPDD